MTSNTPSCCAMHSCVPLCSAPGSCPSHSNKVCVFLCACVRVRARVCGLSPPAPCPPQDVLFTDGVSPWSPPPAMVQRVTAALAEAHRVLRPQGKLLSITIGQVSRGSGEKRGRPDVGNRMAGRTIEH